MLSTIFQWSPYIHFSSVYLLFLFFCLKCNIICFCHGHYWTEVLFLTKFVIFFNLISIIVHSDFLKIWKVIWFNISWFIFVFHNIYLLMLCFFLLKLSIKMSSNIPKKNLFLSQKVQPYLIFFLFLSILIVCHIFFILISQF